MITNLLRTYYKLEHYDVFSLALSKLTRNSLAQQRLYHSLIGGDSTFIFRVDKRFPAIALTCGA